MAQEKARDPGSQAACELWHPSVIAEALARDVGMGEQDHQQLRLPPLALAIRNCRTVRVAAASRNASEPSLEAALPCSGATTAFGQATACKQSSGATVGA